MSNLSKLSPEVIQNCLFRHLPAADRGKLEQTNKHFLNLSRDYLAEDLKKDFGIEPKMFRKFNNTDLQQTIRILYIYLYRFSRVLEKSEMQAVLQIIYNKNDGFLEEILIFCQEIKINLLKKKIRKDIELFPEKMIKLLRVFPKLCHK